MTSLHDSLENPKKIQSSLLTKQPSITLFNAGLSDLMDDESGNNKECDEESSLPSSVVLLG